MRGREELFELVLDEISAYEEWVTDSIHDAAELLTEHSSIEHIEWLAAFERKAYGTAPLLDSIVRDEQRVVDAAVQLGGRKEGFEIEALVKR